MNEIQKLVLGTRGSALARWQANHVARALENAHPGLTVEERIIVTTGDRSQTGKLVDVGGKAVWVKELEEALLAGDIDFAVHSLKDVPGSLPPGLDLAAIPARADGRDALVSRTGQTLASLSPGSTVGTSSPRRECQVRALRPDLVVQLLRGNVDTRLRRVDEGVVDAALLACAGLDRLGYGARIAERLDPEVMLPAVGQGALAIEIRTADDRTRALVGALSDADGQATVAAERALLAGLGGSCRTPLAGYAQVGEGRRLTITGLVGRPSGRDVMRERVEGSVTDAAALGTDLARRLLARGADRILAELG